MKKNKAKSFSTSIPVFIDSVSPVYSNQRHTTMAKLKVFYKGTTQDGRKFSDSFASKILASLPETPVVALYDKEEEDFVGHASTQGVFGYVPENASVYFEEINGQEWAVTDIKLFTEREDVGAIAKKIVGKSHSLELDPSSIVYNTNDDDSADHWIEFTDGNLIGLSVLGDWQSPAFTGSGFFNSQDNTTVSLADIVTKYLSLPKEIEVTQDGGETMFLDFAISQFAGLQIQSVLEDDHFLIYRVGDKTYITLLDEEKQHVNVDITSAFNPTDERTGDEEVGDEEGAAETVEESEESTSEAEETSEDAAEDEAPTEEGSENEENTSGVEDDGTERQEEGQPQPQPEVGVESEASQTQTNETSFSEAEREELENYRRRDKERLITDYVEYLSAESITHFKQSVDSYTINELEKELSVEAMKFIRANKDPETVQDTFAHSFVSKSEPNTREEAIDVSVKKYLKKGMRGEN